LDEEVELSEDLAERTARFPSSDGAVAKCL
jgi:hypothetical protein